MRADSAIYPRLDMPGHSEERRGRRILWQFLIDFLVEASFTFVDEAFPIFPFLESLSFPIFPFMGHSGKEEEEVEEGRQPRMQRQRQDLNSPTQAKRATRPSPEERGDDEDEEAEKKVAESFEEAEVFAPNHYCVHHGGVAHNGKTEMAEAVGHNFNEELGKVTHYDMKLADGTILEGIAAEDIEVTNASLAEGHGHPMKRDDDEEDLDEADKPDYIDLDKDGDKEESMKDAAKDAKSKKLKESIANILRKHLKG